MNSRVEKIILRIEVYLISYANLFPILETETIFVFQSLKNEIQCFG